MQKDNLIVMGVLVTVIGIVAGILGNQISYVNADLQDTRELTYSIPSLQDDIKEIKADVKDIQQTLNKWDNRN